MTNPVNTLSTYAGRNAYYQSKLQQVLRNNLIADKIFEKRTDRATTIQNPYGSQPTAAYTGLTGTYSVSNWTTTDDALTVTDEIVIAEHVYDFETRITEYDVTMNRADEQAYAVSYGIDYYVLNVMLEAGTGTYSTAAGGFTTPSNVLGILADLTGKVAGYADWYKGMFLVIENTDMTGVIQAGASLGFARADQMLSNNFEGNVYNLLNIDIFVVRTGTFANDTIGTQTFTNSSHRMFGIKNVGSYLIPGGNFYYEEKSVSGKTGKEIVTNAPIGAKLWTQKAGLIVDITLN